MVVGDLHTGEILHFLDNPPRDHAAWRLGEAYGRLSDGARAFKIAVVKTAHLGLSAAVGAPSPGRDLLFPLVGIPLDQGFTGSLGFGPWVTTSSCHCLTVPLTRTSLLEAIANLDGWEFGPEEGAFSFADQVFWFEVDVLVTKSPGRAALAALIELGKQARRAGCRRKTAPSSETSPLSVTSRTAAKPSAGAFLPSSTPTSPRRWSV